MFRQTTNIVIIMKNDKISYASDSLSADQKLHYKQCVVQSQDGLTYLFASEVSGSAGIINPRELWKNWDDFSSRVSQSQLESLYHQVFDATPTAKMLKDLTELSVVVWMRLCEVSINRLDNKVSSDKRHAKLQNRAYEILTLEVDPKIKLPPQARTCLAFFAEQVKPVVDAKVASGIALSEVGIITISEAEHQAYVIANAARLNTRQDPWRIFQYYRPTLIQNKFIRMV